MKYCKTIFFLATMDSYSGSHVIDFSKPAFFQMNLCKVLLIYKLISSGCFGANPCVCTQSSLAFWQVSNKVSADPRAEEEREEKQGRVSYLQIYHTKGKKVNSAFSPGHAMPKSSVKNLVTVTEPKSTCCCYCRTGRGRVSCPILFAVAEPELKLAGISFSLPDTTRLLCVRVQFFPGRN